MMARLRNVLLVAVFAALMVGSGFAQRTEDFMVAMRDGTRLATTVIYPEGEGPWPAVLVRTPYNKDGIKGGGKMFTDAGMAVVGQDCRGRYKSEGDYVPFLTDREDGYDSVEWAAGQPWCTGKVGMWGGSAVGITTYLAAASRPPHLVAGYAIVAPADWRLEILFTGGGWRKSLIDGWMDAQKSREVRIDWQKKPVMDPYFNWLEMPRYYDSINVPIAHIGGWFDIFAEGTVRNFVGMQAKGQGPARGGQKLTMAAIGHGGLSCRWKEYPNKGGEMGHGIDAVRWFRYWLKGEDNGIMKEPAIHYFVMGDAENPLAPGNEWRTADAWPPVPTTPASFYLQPGGGLSSAASTAETAKSEYAYDPANPVPSKGGQELILPKGPMDQREIGERQDYLRFTSEPLTEAMEFIGDVVIELNVQTDAPDTDFVAKLVDVYPDGYEALLGDSMLRMRYRNGFDREVMMTPEEIATIKIGLGPTAYIIDKGHRLAVHVTSSNSPRFDPNPNTGKPLRADEETRIARNAVYHDKARPSRVILPKTEAKYQSAGVEKVAGKIFKKAE